ncbi:hypothetical protein EU78_04650 [Mycolicibacterium rufum]|nr:hypothetical protein EU78_04650 [Mycolicibacterium rufum]
MFSLSSNSSGEVVDEGNQASTHRTRRPTTGSARYVGRIGALAVALGIGTALACAPGVAFAETPDSSVSQSSAGDAAGAPRPSVAHPRSARHASAGAHESADAPTTERRHATHSRTTAPKRAHSGRSDTDKAEETDSDGAGTTAARAPRRLARPTEAADEPATTASAPASPAPRRTLTAGRAAQETSPTPADESATATTTVAVKVPTTLSTSLPTRPRPAKPAQVALLSTLLAWTRRASGQTPDPTGGVTDTSAPTPAQVVTTAPRTATAASTSAGINLPASATVFTLRGMNVLGSTTSPMPKQYGGMFAKAPYTMVELKYTAAWNKTSITEGVQILDAALLSTPGDIIVMAHSEGAQVASRWMRTYANDPTRAALASRVTFLLSGNPLRSSQGGGGQMIGGWENDGTRALPTPTTTPWPIIDVARRWDGWADWPSDTTNKVAVRNATIGMTTFHTNYTNVNLYDPANTVWHNGNTTYVLTHENTPPLISMYLFADPNFVSVVRGQVEAAYRRPANDTPVPVVPTTSAYYQKILVKLGIPNAAPSRSAVTA